MGKAGTKLPCGNSERSIREEEDQLWTATESDIKSEADGEEDVIMRINSKMEIRYQSEGEGELRDGFFQNGTNRHV